MKSLVVIQWRKSLDGERSGIRGYKSTTDRRWDVILTLCSPARPCQSSSSLYYYYISASSSLSSSTNQLKWEFKLEIDWRLACVPFSTLIVCVCVVMQSCVCWFPAGSWSDVMSNGNTLTGLPVQWSEQPELPAACWVGPDRLTRGLLLFLSVWDENISLNSHFMWKLFLRQTIHSYAWVIDNTNQTEVQKTCWFYILQLQTKDG